MKEVIFATGNKDKFAMAHKTCGLYGFELVQKDFDVDEIQGEDMERIVGEKAKSAFITAQQPVVVSDDFWSVTELNGFPGAYMKSMNQWFSVDHFIRLFSGLENKEICLLQNLAYFDGENLKVFTNKTPGRLIDKPRGVSGPASAKLIELEGDGGRTISEIFDLRKTDDTHKDEDRHAAKVWHQFSGWYAKTIN